MYSVEELMKDKKKFYYVAKTVFKVIDTDDSGKISEDELWLVVCSLADDFGYQRPTFHEVTEILRLIDSDTSGVIEFPEFRKLLGKIFKAYEARIQQEEEMKKIKYQKSLIGINL